MKKKIGVLSLEGTFPMQYFLSERDCEVVKVQKSEDLLDINGLIITGSEYQKDLDKNGLGDRIKELAARDFPIFGICSGMVVLSKGSYGQKEYQLGLMDIKVSIKPAIADESKVYLSIPVLGKKPVGVILNNTTIIEEIAPNVGILAEYNGKIVFVRQGNMLASSFHPELTSADHINRYFLDIVNGQI